MDAIRSRCHGGASQLRNRVDACLPGILGFPVGKAAVEQGVRPSRSRRPGSLPPAAPVSGESSQPSRERHHPVSQRSLTMKSTTLIRPAIYARVSSERQADEATIESQLAALRERVAADGMLLAEELAFVDDGYSGTTLMRPALERLRDMS